ncbi:hypothetical protein LCGC14_1563190 [marine sediment metagenome]|uniref:Uncharacterized protein n=1 Tax=marine sediment metagenome TaxID=412755 RepID=A0A0F9LMJ7_9ZZZZ
MPCYVGEKIAICTGSNRRFIARYRWYGCRRYQIVSEHRSYRVAVKAMAKAFAKPNHSMIKRADVIMTADYYDPVQLCELVRK